jgi:hypothetical protein
VREGRRDGGMEGGSVCDNLLEGVFFSASEVKLPDTDAPTLTEFPEEERERERERKREEERWGGGKIRVISI